jgi:hypothetical protein
MQEVSKLIGDAKEVKDWGLQFSLYPDRIEGKVC